MSPNTPHTPHDFANQDKTTGVPGYDSYDAPVHLAPGKIIMDKFVVIEHLGTGGMGSVFKVQHLHLKTFYALKCLNHKQGNDAIWRRFENEARAANRLDHPNLIRVYDSGLLSDGQPYFVMDLVEGTTLGQELAARGTLSLSQALKIFIQVGFALSYAHSNGVIHRDIKPSNIMVVKNASGSLGGSVKVVDFGIAKLTGKDEYNQMTLTRTGEVFGSPLYMSPEQCMGVSVDHRSDLYSLGCVMYEALTGAPPVVGENALTTMMKHQTETPTPLRQASLGLEFPDSIQYVVAKLLEKDPEKRYQNASLLTADLVAIEQGQVFKEHEVADNNRTLVAIPGAVPAKRKDSHTMMVVIAFLMLLLGFAIGFLVGRGVPVSTQPTTGAGTATADPRVQITALGTALAGLDVEKDGTLSKLDSKPFSTIFDNGRTRVFDFPADKIIAMRCSEGWNPWPTPQRALMGHIAMNNFEPMLLSFEMEVAGAPIVFAKFRSDEVRGVKMSSITRNITEILNYLSAYKNLDSLWFEDTSFNKNNISQLNALKALTFLDLNRSDLTGHDIAKVDRLCQLQHLDCGSIPQLSDALTKLKHTSNLTSLALNSCKLTNEDVKSIGQIPNLAYLDLTNNTAVDDESLQHLSNLTKLVYFDLQNCPITAKSIATFKKMPKLSILKLQKDGFTPEQASTLKKTVKFVQWYEPKHVGNE